MPRFSRIRSTFMYATLVMIFISIATPAHAGVFGSIRSWFSAEAAALVASAAAVLASSLLGLVYTRAIKTFRETGEFLTALGMALEDNRLTRDELAQIIREGRDIFTVWR